MAKEKDNPEPRRIPTKQAEKDEFSPLFYYHCQHGASNEPDRCFPADAEIMPDNWFETYEPPKDGGISDEASVG